MLKIKIALVTAVLPSIVLTSAHFAARGFTILETRALAYFDTIKDQAIDTLLTYTGRSLPSTASEMSLREIIQQEAKSKGIKPELIEALIEVESNWKPDAIRFEPSLMQGIGDQARMKASSHGLTQILGLWAGKSICPSVKTWADLYEPHKNISCGTSILAEGLKHGSVYKALIAYNGGDGCFKNPKCMTQAEGHAMKVMAVLAEKMLQN